MFILVTPHSLPVTTFPNALLDGDPDNYLTYFKRATVYLALGKSRSALPDLDKVVILKPDFNAVS